MSTYEENLAKFDKPYDPAAAESRWYSFWEERGYFQPDLSSAAPRYCITIPPPNVTGSLHMGHALCYTLHDILVRYKKLRGYNVLCLPGTDHAGIGTQAKVEDQLAAEGKTRHDLGRERFLERMWEWKEKFGNLILKQFRAMGYAFDWSRTRFTMDEGYSEAVREAFVRLFDKGLIYRGERIVNWCPRCGTALSDLEVEHQEHASHLWHLRYPLEDGSGEVIVATTRPETMLGDTGVAVHPSDERYKHLVGKRVRLPLMNRLIPIVADHVVDRAFGTGAVKVTPAHDPNDWEIAERCGLERITVIDKTGRMTQEAGEFAGLDRFEARKRVVEALEAQGYLVKTEDYVHSVGHCSRCKTVLEPLLAKQWFVKMKPLAEAGIRLAEEGKVRFIPERFKRFYLDWMHNLRDWCVSRQIWWGHRLPIFTCKACGHQWAAKVDPETCPQCGGSDLEQDPDVLDTWFSSALWPFATLGWPHQTRELELFYPTNVLITARDILYLWVARMIMTSAEFMGVEPFGDVYIYATVLNSEGRRMSKSLGTGVDPLELTSKYGTDALRFGLIYQAATGQDLRFGTGRIEMSRNFCNKLWNASRFILTNLIDAETADLEGTPESTQLVDKWILSRFEYTRKLVTEAIENYDFNDAAIRLRTFVWNELCDWYLELAKPRLLHGETAEKRTVQRLLFYLLKHSLILLHPFMPFATEEIYQALPIKLESLMVEQWPDAHPEWQDEAVEATMGHLMDLVGAARNLRAELKLPPAQVVPCAFVGGPEAELQLVKDNELLLLSLARLEKLEYLSPEARPEKALSALAGKLTLYFPLEGLVDVQQEIARLQKELKRVASELERVQKKLANERFLAKAPPAVVEKERAKQAEFLEQQARLRERLAQLEG